MRVRRTRAAWAEAELRLARAPSRLSPQPVERAAGCRPSLPPLRPPLRRPLPCGLSPGAAAPAPTAHRRQTAAGTPAAHRHAPTRASVARRPPCRPHPSPVAPSGWNSGKTRTRTRNCGYPKFRVMIRSGNFWVLFSETRIFKNPNYLTRIFRVTRLPTPTRDQPINPPAFSRNPSPGPPAMASASAAAVEWEDAAPKVLVARKPGFGLPTACPTCLPILLYLRMAQVPFDVHVDTSFPDADHIPYVEFGDCVAFNNEKGGVIEYLREGKIVDLNSKHPSVSHSDVLSTKAMVLTWLSDALQYELWVATEASLAHDIYFSDLPWPIGKILHWKKTREVKQLLGITKLNAAEKEEEIYQKASAAYDALSLRLGDQAFLFDISPTDVDVLFLGHALFVLNALPDSSVLRSALQKYDNLVNFSERLKVQFASSSGLGVSSDPSSSSTPKKRASSGRSYKPKPREKTERTEEQKTFRRRAKFFLATQLVAVLMFLSLMGGVDSSELDDDDGLYYED